MEALESKFSEELDISELKTCLDTMGLKGLIVVISRGWGMNIKSKVRQNLQKSICLIHVEKAEEVTRSCCLDF